MVNTNGCHTLVMFLNKAVQVQDTLHLSIITFTDIAMYFIYYEKKKVALSRS